VTTIPLEYPVEYGGATYSELKLGRLNAGALAKLEAGIKERGLGDADKIRPAILLIAQATGLPEEVINLLDAEDFGIANEAVADFLSPRRRSKAKLRG
jgi:hypothetical protein